MSVCETVDDEECEVRNEVNDTGVRYDLRQNIIVFLKSEHVYIEKGKLTGHM